MFNILGIYSGIGPNLYPAKQLGWNILANFEPRDGFHSGTWELNFDSIPIYKNWDRIEDYIGKVDILVAFPTCRFFSQAGFQWLTPEQRAKKQANFGELEKYKEIITLIKPKMFLMENVQPLLKYYQFSADGYNMQNLRIINADYGNCQLRKRLWIIGKTNDINFSFTPPLFIQTKVLRDIISDLPVYNDMENIQHIHHPETGTRLSRMLSNCGGITRGIDGKSYLTIEEIAEYSFMFPAMTSLPYINKKGEEKCRIGLMRCSWNRRAPVIGVSNGKLHPDTGLPLTIRERARILGFPDTFLFTGPYKDQLIQTGACIPLEFPTYLYKLIEEQNK